MIFDKRCCRCLISRIAYEGECAGADIPTIKKIEDEAGKIIQFLLAESKWTHPMIASFLHRSVYSMLSCPDPFIQVKTYSDAEAYATASLVRDRLHTFRDYVLASVIANTYDYAVLGHEVTTNFLGFFNESFAQGLYIDHTDQIMACCKRVVYFTDNCGEIVFDRLLLEYLHNQGVYLTVIVRDAPILNDATMKEAREQKIEGVCDELIPSGAGAEHGIRFDLLPDDARRALDDCTLIISKGMANYESLREFEGLPPVAYLLSAKCQPIAEELRVPRGSKIALLKK